MDYSAIIGAGSGFAVLVIGKLIEWYKTRSDTKINEKKQDAEERLKEEQSRVTTSIPLNDQAVLIYRQVVDDLRKDAEVMKNSLHLMDKELLTAKEAAIMSRAVADNQKAELETLRKQVLEIEPLRKRVSELEGQIQQLNNRIEVMKSEKH